MTPLISVIIPVHNEQAYLACCLDTVLGQTLSDIEVLCVDDGSSDASLAILHGYATKDSRIRVFRPGKIGVGPARNMGIEHARGEYIGFMDADDTYPEAHTLEKLYRTARERHALICGGSFSSFDSRTGEINARFSGRMAPYTFHSDGMRLFRDYQFPYGYQRFLFDRQFLREKGIAFPGYERFQDPPFLIRAMLAAESFYAITDVTYAYRRQHRRVDWTTRKNTDFLRGVADCLEVSNLHALDRLHIFLAGIFARQFRRIPSFGVEQDASFQKQLTIIHGLLRFDLFSLGLKIRLAQVFYRRSSSSNIFTVTYYFLQQCFR